MAAGRSDERRRREDGTSPCGTSSAPQRWRRARRAHLRPPGGAASRCRDSAAPQDQPTQSARRTSIAGSAVASTSACSARSNGGGTSLPPWPGRLSATTRPRRARGSIWALQRLESMKSPCRRRRSGSSGRRRAPWMVNTHLPMDVCTALGADRDSGTGGGATVAGSMSDLLPEDRCRCGWSGDDGERIGAASAPALVKGAPMRAALAARAVYGRCRTRLHGALGWSVRIRSGSGKRPVVSARRGRLRPVS